MPRKSSRRVKSVKKRTTHKKSKVRRNKGRKASKSQKGGLVSLIIDGYIYMISMDRRTWSLLFTNGQNVAINELHNDIINLKPPTSTPPKNTIFEKKQTHDNEVEVCVVDNNTKWIRGKTDGKWDSWYEINYHKFDNPVPSEIYPSDP
jgi:hypothetical protein